MPASTVYLVHDDRDESGGECTPRISLDCSACGESVVYCHLSSDVLRKYVDPAAPIWLCSSCGGAS